MGWRMRWFCIHGSGDLPIPLFLLFCYLFSSLGFAEKVLLVRREKSIFILHSRTLEKGYIRLLCISDIASRQIRGEEVAIYLPRPSTFRRGVTALVRGHINLQFCEHFSFHLVERDFSQIFRINLIQSIHQIILVQCGWGGFFLCYGEWTLFGER